MTIVDKYTDKNGRHYYFKCMICDHYTPVKENYKAEIEFDNLNGSEFAVMACKNCHEQRQHRLMRVAKEHLENIKQDRVKNQQWINLKMPKLYTYAEHSMALVRRLQDLSW